MTGRSVAEAGQLFLELLELNCPAPPSGLPNLHGLPRIRPCCPLHQSKQHPGLKQGGGSDYVSAVGYTLMMPLAHSKVQKQE